MFKKIENTPEDTFGLEMAGKITKEDYEKMDAIMEDYQKEHDHIKFLAVIREFEWASSQAMWEDFKLELRYFKHIDKAAVVTNMDWKENIAEIMGSVAPELPVKTFHLNEKDKAIEWLETESPKKNKML